MCVFISRDVRMLCESVATFIQLNCEHNQFLCAPNGSETFQSRSHKFTVCVQQIIQRGTREPAKANALFNQHALLFISY